MFNMSTTVQNPKPILQLGKIRNGENGWYVDTRDGTTYPMASDCYDMTEGEHVVFSIDEFHFVQQTNWEPCTFTPLTEEQGDELLALIKASKGKGENLFIVRFLLDGCAMNLERGLCASKGSNVMYHPTYWDVPYMFIERVKTIYPTCTVDSQEASPTN